MTNEKEVLKKVDKKKRFLSRTRARTYYIRRGNLLYAGMEDVIFVGVMKKTWPTESLSATH